PLVPSTYSGLFRHIVTKEDLARVWPLYQRMVADTSIPHPNTAYGFILGRASQLGATEHTREIYSRLAQVRAIGVRTVEDLFVCAAVAGDRVFGEWAEAELVTL